MEVIDGKVEANEALLTGESDLTEKEIGDTLLLEVSLLADKPMPVLSTLVPKTML